MRCRPVQRVIWPELNLELSRLAFGCAPVMGRVGAREAVNAMAKAYELGVTHFDVARSYGFGDAERVLGRFIADKRSRVTVATKFGILPDSGVGAAKKLLRPLVRVARNHIPAIAGAVKAASGKSLVRASYDPQSVRRSVEASLRELDTEVIDVLFAHDCGVEDGIDRIVPFLDDLKRAGKIRAWGLATDAASVGRIGSLLGRHPDVIQVPYLGSETVEALPSRKLLHSSISIAKRFFGGDGRLLPPVESWAQHQGLDRRAASELLPRLLLQATLNGSSDSVVICSMFAASHIAANVEQVDSEVVLRPLLPSFRAMALPLLAGGASQAAADKRPLIPHYAS
jgi:aryl-alcohol dehydrogenase-like predicted oxidoreductase